MTFGAVKRIPISALATVALGFATPASPNEYRDNPSIILDRVAEKQLLPIGELESVANHMQNGKSVKVYGTAFLISPCYIITNHHVAFWNDAQPLPGKDYTMLFRAGTSANAAFAGNTKAVPVKWALSVWLVRMIGQFCN